MGTANYDLPRITRIETEKGSPGASLYLLYILSCEAEDNNKWRALPDYTKPSRIPPSADSCTPGSCLRMHCQRDLH